MLGALATFAAIGLAGGAVPDIVPLLQEESAAIRLAAADASAAHPPAGSAVRETLRGDVGTGWTSTCPI